MMKTSIPSDRTNILEKDIEDWLYNNPSELEDKIMRYGQLSLEWIGRQVKVPSGIIDLLGLVKSSQGFEFILIVEVKNVTLDASHLTQVCRYAKDIERAYEYAQSRILQVPYVEPESCHVSKMVIVPDKKFPNKLQHEADALNVSIHSFNVNLSLEITGRWSWTPKAKNIILEDQIKTNELLFEYLSKQDEKEIPFTGESGCLYGDDCVMKDEEHETWQCITQEEYNAQAKIFGANNEATQNE